MARGLLDRMFKRTRRWLASMRKQPEREEQPPIPEIGGLSDEEADTVALPPLPEREQLPEPPQYSMPGMQSPVPMEAGTPHLYPAMKDRQEQQPLPPMPDMRKDEPEVLDRREESKARTDARIGIRQARKEGDSKRADDLRLQEIARRADASGASGTAVMPNEYSDSAPSPFEWSKPPQSDPVPQQHQPGFPRMSRLEIPDEQRKQIERQAETVLPPPITGDVKGASSQSSPELTEIARTLKEMAESLRNIDGKLPQTATYSR